VQESGCSHQMPRMQQPQAPGCHLVPRSQLFVRRSVGVQAPTFFMQVAALLPGTNLRMKHFGERYCQGGFNKFDKFAGGLPATTHGHACEAVLCLRRTRGYMASALMRLVGWPAPHLLDCRFQQPGRAKPAAVRGGDGAPNESRGPAAAARQAPAAGAREP
jgi:hypothetical protein